MFFLSFMPGAMGEDATAKKLFEEMNKSFENLAALSYTATRTTISGTKSIEEKWDFRLKAPGLIKIEYYRPDRRLVIIDDATLWEYIPAAKKARRTDFATMKENDKAELVASVMSHVAIDGLRIGDYSKLLAGVTKVTEGKDNIYVIEGQKPKFVIHVNGEKKILLHSEFYNDKGELIMKTDASQFAEAVPGFWFPKNIDAVYRTENGMIKSAIVMSNVRANDNPADMIFKFTPPEGVKVLTAR